MTHERLSIVGIGISSFFPKKFPSRGFFLTVTTDSGAQPLVNEEETIFLAVNGEIYNHRILRKQLDADTKFKTHSDCEVILHLVRPSAPREN